MELLEYLQAKRPSKTEAFLKSCIDDAIGDILLYTQRETVPEELEYLVKKLALWHVNRDGIEGFDSFSEAGTSMSVHSLNSDELATMQRFRVFQIGGNKEHKEDKEDKKQ